VDHGRLTPSSKAGGRGQPCPPGGCVGVDRAGQARL